MMLGMHGIRGRLTYLDEGLVEDRVVLIEDGLVEGVVGSPDVPDGVTIADWGNVALFPGTVNAHGHAFQNLLKGFADDRPFDAWRDEVLYPYSERLDAEAIYAGALFAFAEAMLAGVTTTVDFFYLHDGGNDNARHVMRAASDLGIRLVFARTFYDVDAPTRAPARYREEPRAAARRCIELAEEYANDPLVSIQPAPHSLHAASPETIALALEVAERLDVPCHLHLAEARYEREQVLDRYGTTPVRLLEREGLLGPRLLTIHTVHVDDEELDMLAASGTGVVHCPGANAFLGDGIARVPEMLARGVRVALGPDGGCANNRQNVFDEMRMAALVAKARLEDGAALDAPTVLRLGTKGGAELLGVRAGALQEGTSADIVALDLDDLSLQPIGTLERQIVYSMQQRAIARVMVAGETVVAGGRTIGVEPGAIRRRIADVTDAWSRP
jgi:5-methylthioadenosine/S-adenosylhomocysteine deaminase